MKFVNPTYKSAVTVKARMLGAMEYIIVKDTVKGSERVERGPKLLFLGAYDEVMREGSGLTLGETEYVFVTDKLSGIARTEKGPCVWYPEAHEEATGAKKATALQEDEWIRIKDDKTGMRWIQRGKALIFPEPSWKFECSPQKAWTLKSFEYVRLLDSVTGNVSVHRGPQIVFPGSNEKLLDADKLSAIDLKADEYVKIEDQSDGKVRIVAGVNKVFLGPNDYLPEGGKKKAQQIDEEHAVLVRDTATGQLRLVTEKQLFIPSPTEAIEEVRQLITLAEHEAVIVKDKDSNCYFHYGNAEKAKAAGTQRSFFLQPYCNLEQLWWSSGLRRAKRDLCIERFDCRAQFMWFEFDCRTQDNVELVLECTFFWEVVDLATLYRATGNLPGDIYNQARSQFIKKVAQNDLGKFMTDLHIISGQIFNDDKDFYKRRGVKIHSLEVTKYKCVEARTSEVLNQIIEENTNRLNRKSKAEGENEVNLAKVKNEIELEKSNGSLLEIRHRHTQQEAEVKGKAEAQSVAAFLQGIEKTVPKLEDRINMWQTLRKNDALNTVSTGGANLYYTPNDVNLSIRT
eukprot:TRINITY_DN26704_c0_g2_i1.p1 TRINITY_DN26704_c0_g2~~TRINITY_DN26704_c0_g2_i1.p1  ORF type:complete len:646 (+),score=186.41 TRINITY_DN26704_c0_g2_i1:230-1939(+)